MLMLTGDQDSKPRRYCWSSSGAVHLCSLFYGGLSRLNQVLLHYEVSSKSRANEDTIENETVLGPLLRESDKRKKKKKGQVIFLFLTNSFLNYFLNIWRNV